MKTEDILKEMGFTSYISDLAPNEFSYRYRIGRSGITALPCTGMYLQPIFHISGVLSDQRSLREISFDMPLEVESYEQGVALIAQAIGRNFKPSEPIEWFEQGKSWEIHLPGRKRLAEYEKRPKCEVDRDWARIAFRKLRQVAADIDEAETATLSFDGEALKIKVAGQTVLMAASGKAWEQTYSVKAKSLDFLPQRIIRDSIWFSVWDGYLTIDRRRWSLFDQKSLEFQ